MSLSSYTDYLAAQQHGQVIIFGKSQNNASGLISSWARDGSTTIGATPTTAAVPSQTAAGALQQSNAAAQLRLARSIIATSVADNQFYMLCDRLSHQGGLSGTTTGAQTTNLPTAALTRYTSGVGVMAGLEIYSALGTSATTCTVEYVDEAGATQTSPAFTVGSNNFNGATRLIPIPLIAGGLGVRAVNNVNLAGSTGSAGNFGVTLYRPLAVGLDTHMEGLERDLLIGGGCLSERILDDACLFVMGYARSSGTFQGSFTFIDA